MRPVRISGAMALAVLFGVAGSAQTPAKQSDQVTFTKDVAPILQRSCQSLSSAGKHRADVAADLSGRAAVGARDQTASGAAQHAAVVHRPGGRHPQLQERSFAERSGNRDDLEVGGCGRAGGQSGRHAAAAQIRRQRPLAHRQARYHRHVEEGRGGEGQGAGSVGGSADRRSGYQDRSLHCGGRSEADQRHAGGASRRRDDGVRGRSRATSSNRCWKNTRSASSATSTRRAPAG